MLGLICGDVDTCNKRAVIEKDLHKPSWSGNFPDGGNCGLDSDTSQEQIPLNKNRSTVSSSALDND